MWRPSPATPTTHSRKDGKWGTIHLRSSLVRLLAFVWLFTSAVVALAQPVTVHEIFKGEGTNANTFLDGVGVNGIGTAMFLDVFQDARTGDTFLLLRVTCVRNAARTPPRIGCSALFRPLTS